MNFSEIRFESYNTIILTTEQSDFFTYTTFRNLLYSRLQVTFIKLTHFIDFIFDICENIRYRT
jgi:hypothetical protein